MSERKKPDHISREDWDDLDIPELTDEDFARMRPAREVFAELGLEMPKPRSRGPQKAPTKVQTTLRLDREVVEHFRAAGRGWQGRINDTLKKAVARARKGG
ncbi:MAG: BrnA antitoxin family protein [Bauldia sp.]|nr:BrnA antitoxin family protein [Bauldia sp.]